MKMENASTPLRSLVRKIENDTGLKAVRWHAGSHPGEAVVYFEDGSQITYSAREIQDEAIELSR
jgi:hypothetical protein